MKRITTIILLVATLCLGALCVIVKVLTDDTPPAITVPSVDMVYYQGDNTSELLAGVKAYDNEDGDISANVRIYDVSPVEDETTALVTYAVYDSDYNLSKATKIVNYVALPKTTTEEDTTEEVATEATTTEEEPEDEVIEPGYEDPVMVSTGAPVIRLTTHELRLPVGGYFYSMDYVDEVVDDVDTMEYMYRNVYLDGEYDVNTPGEYELTYYCIDSNGNESNAAKLMLIIGETEE